MTAYDDTTNDAGTVTIDAGCLGGTVTSDVVDLSSVASRWWSLLVESYETDLVTLEELDFACDSGEGRMRTLLTREASAGRPGADFSRTISDAWRLDDATLRLCGPRGARGENTAHKAELRFSDDNVTWTDYMAWAEGYYSARYAQARVTLYRRGSKWQRHLTKCLLKVGEV